MVFLASFIFPELSCSVMSQNRGRIPELLCCLLHPFIPALAASQGHVFLDQPSCYLTFSRACSLENLYIHSPQKCMLVVLFRKPDIRNMFRRDRLFYFQKVKNLPLYKSFCLSKSWILYWCHIWLLGVNFSPLNEIERMLNENKLVGMEEIYNETLVSEYYVSQSLVFV